MNCWNLSITKIFSIIRI